MCTSNCKGYCNLVGFRFSPSDEEIFLYYLWNKMIGYDDNLTRAIAEVDLLQFEPWDLPRRSAIKSNDSVWYFFCRRDNKDANRKRASRLTNEGYWKSTGQDREILQKGTGKQLGTKKTLVFHKGRVPNGVGTNWAIHEYRPVPATTPPNSRDYVVCRLEKRPVEKRPVKKNSPSNKDDPGSSSASTSNVADNALTNGGPRLEAITEPFTGYNELDYELALQASMEENNCLFDEDLLDPIGLGYDQNRMQEQGLFHNDTDMISNDFLVEQNVSEASEADELEMEFVNSMFADEDELIYEENVNSNTLQHDYTPWRSHTRVYMDGGSETETIMGSVQNQPHNSKGSCQNQEENDFNYEDILIFDTSLGGSAAATHYELDSPDLVQKNTFINTRTFKSQYQPRSHEPRAEEAPKSFQLKCGSSSGNAVSRAKERKTKEDLSIRSSESAGSNRGGSSIFKEMPQLTFTTRPPSEYVCNVVLGVILFIVVLIQAATLH